MNTISSTFDENLCNCTVLGGTQSNPNARFPVSVLILNRNSGSFKEQNFDELVKAGFESIISIENPKDNYKVDGYSRKYPQISFLMPEKQLSVGSMINLAMTICTSEHLLVIWDDVTVKLPVISDAVFRKYMDSEAICFVPMLSNSYFQNANVRMVPTMNHFNFKILPKQVVYDNSSTLFPFDYIGIYNKNRFINMGGFDTSITTPYWQLLDFSVRSWLWGEKFIISTLFRFSYINNEPVYDVTSDNSYFRFFLKCIAPNVKLDYGYVPIRSFITFHRNSNYSFGPAITEFRHVRKWVAKNKFRYKLDIKKLMDSWKDE